MKYYFKITLNNNAEISIDISDILPGRLSIEKIDNFTCNFLTREEFLEYLENKKYIIDSSQVKKILIETKRTYKNHIYTDRVAIAYETCKDYIDYNRKNLNAFRDKFKAMCNDPKFINSLHRVPSIRDEDIVNLENLENLSSEEKKQVLNEILNEIITNDEYKRIRDVCIIFYKNKIKKGEIAIPKSRTNKKQFKENYYNGEQFSNNPAHESLFLPEEQQKFDEYMKSLDDSYGENKDTFGEFYGPKKR